MKTLTLDDLKSLKRGIFATGIGEIPSVESEYYLGSPVSMRVVKWVAVKGNIEDWAIYYMNGSLESNEEIRQNGAKLVDGEYIAEFVPCTSEVLAHYRY